MTAYHVTLGGQGFLVEPASYAVRALAQVPAEALLSGTAPAMTDPFFERVQRQRRFGGDGVQRFANALDPEGWTSGSGLVLTTASGLRLGPALVDSGAGAVFGLGVRAFAVFRGRLYAGLEAAPGDVWSFDGSTWALAFSTGKPGIRSLAVYRDALYVGNGGDGVVHRWDGATLSTAWTNTGVTAVDAMAVAWVEGSARLFLANSAAGGQGWLQSYDGGTQSIVAVVEEPQLDALAVASGRVYVCASHPSGQPRGSLYSCAGTAASFRHERAFGDGYAVSAVALGEEIVLGWSSGARLLGWSPTTQALADLPLGASSASGSARALATFEGALWVAASDAASATIGVRRYDPATGGWSLAAVGAAGDEPLALATFGGSLYLGVRRASGAAAAYRLDQSTRAAAAELDTCPFDGGLPDLQKALRAVDLQHPPLPAGSSVAVDYRLDGNPTWTALGTASMAGSEHSSLPFPAASSGRSAVFRLRFARASAPAEGPELRELALRYVLAPVIRRAWTMAVRLEGDARRPLRRLDHTLEPLTGRQLSAALWALRAEAGPLSFVDLEGASHQVWFRDLEEVPQKTLPLDPAQPWTAARITLVEA